MNSRAHLFLLAFSLLFLALIITATWAFLRDRRSQSDDWGELLHRLRPVDRDSVALIALDLLLEPAEPASETMNLSAEEIHLMIGGLQGLRTLEANCEVLIQLAAYMQRWFPEAVIVAQEMRLTAEEIRWHVRRLEGASRTGNLTASFPAYAQRAVAAYYMMTRSLLKLYQAVSTSKLRELEALL